MSSIKKKKFKSDKPRKIGRKKIKKVAVVGLILIHVSDELTGIVLVVFWELILTTSNKNFKSPSYPNLNEFFIFCFVSFLIQIIQQKTNEIN